MEATCVASRGPHASGTREGNTARQDSFYSAGPRDFSRPSRRIASSLRSGCLSQVFFRKLQARSLPSRMGWISPRIANGMCRGFGARFPVPFLFLWQARMENCLVFGTDVILARDNRCGTVWRKMRENGFWNREKCFRMNVTRAVGV